MINLKHILVPTDFSSTSDVAVRYAKEFAVAFKSHLHVLHVADDPFLLADSTDKKYRDQACEEALAKLDELTTDEEREHLRIKTLVRCGTAGPSIIKYAKEANIDLIVVGSHGRGALQTLLLGSVAEAVLRNSPCPVLTVKLPEHEFVEP